MTPLFLLKNVSILQLPHEALYRFLRVAVKRAQTEWLQAAGTRSRTVLQTGSLRPTCGERRSVPEGQSVPRRPPGSARCWQSAGLLGGRLATAVTASVITLVPKGGCVPRTGCVHPSPCPVSACPFVCGGHPHQTPVRSAVLFQTINQVARNRQSRVSHRHTALQCSGQRGPRSPACSSWLSARGLPR